MSHLVPEGVAYLFRRQRLAGGAVDRGDEDVPTPVVDGAHTAAAQAPRDLDGVSVRADAQAGGKAV